MQFFKWFIHDFFWNIGREIFQKSAIFKACIEGLNNWRIRKFKKLCQNMWKNFSFSVFFCFYLSIKSLLRKNYNKIKNLFIKAKFSFYLLLILYEIFMGVSPNNLVIDFFFYFIPIRLRMTGFLSLNASKM